MVRQMPRPRTVIITQEELLRNPEEREARRKLAERLRKCAQDQAEAVADLLDGTHRRRIKETMKQINEATGQQP